MSVPPGPDPVIEGSAVEEPADGTPTASPEASPGTLGADLAVIDSPQAGAIIRAESPTEVIAKATQVADALKGLIEQQGLAVNLDKRKPNRKHVEVGGWQALGAMLGALGGQPLHAETVWTRKVAGPDGAPVRTTYTATVRRYHSKASGGGLREEVTYDVNGHDWEAFVQIRTPAGVIVGSAEAMCSRAENTWAQRDDYAVRSMAETRAESRAYRRAVGWIVSIAGYNPTPAEEMGHTPGADTSPAPAAAPTPGWARDVLPETLERAHDLIGDLIGQGGETDGPGLAAVNGVIEQIRDACGGTVPAAALIALGHARLARRALSESGEGIDYDAAPDPSAHDAEPPPGALADDTAAPAPVAA